LAVASHFASGQRLFAYAAGEEKKAEGEGTGGAEAAGSGAGIPAASSRTGKDILGRTGRSGPFYRQGIRY